jgi:hypothetical protein
MFNEFNDKNSSSMTKQQFNDKNISSMTKNSSSMTKTAVQ